MFRHRIANVYRSFPKFRGKGRLGILIGQALTKLNFHAEPIVAVRMRNGTLMEIDVRSRTEQWAYWTGEYDAEIITRLSACLPQGCVVFDIGANVGFYSIALGPVVRSLQGTVHAFEPVEANYHRLMKCIALNGLGSVIYPHKIALGDEEGTVDMYMDVRGNAQTGNAVMCSGQFVAENTMPRSCTARIARLDAFVGEIGVTRCDMIKIDVEGAELLFLRGGTEFLTKCRPIIYGEFNSYWMNQFSHSFVDVANLVKSWEYRIFIQEKHGVQFKECLHAEVGMENALLCPSETAIDVLRRLGITGV